ncbi:MAG TPA: hypothetical protein VFL91_06395 [Thermomicrobiales bacterium]|nr:hypothetical protein [Thermomicrobiales bacterium]
MSTRFDYGWDDEGGIPAALWEHNLRRALTSKRGLATLRDLEAALLALPEKKLIAGDMAYPSGAVCAVGAYSLYKRLQRGEDREAALLSLCSREGPYETALEGQRYGMAYTLAWEIAERNDEIYGGAYTEEGRYQEMLAWVRRQLAAAEAS